MSGSASGAAAAAEDEEVVIEEIPPEMVTEEAKEDDHEPQEETANKDKEEDDDDDVPLPDDASPQDIEIAKIEKEKKKMDATQKLERALLWKIEGNKFFKGGEMAKAGDAYYHAIIFCRELTHNPQYYPKYGHNEEQRKIAQDMCENVYTNLALVQLKYGAALDPTNEELPKVLEEAVKSASEALKINGKNLKALFRRAQAKERMSELGKPNAEAQELLGEAKTDLLAVLEEDKQNRDARVQLKTLQDKLKALKKEEVETEKKTFSFGSTLSGLGTKEKDLLGDGSIKKKLESAGDGGKWVNEDWLLKDAPIKCVVHLRCSLLHSKAAEPVTLSFVLGDRDMHEGFSTAVRSMTVGEVAHFTFAAQRLSANTVLTGVLPKPSGETSTWELKFLKFVTWHDIDRNGEQLLKVQEEGWGRKPETFSEVFIHWRVFGPDGSMIHSSRNTVDLGDGTGGGFRQVEDEDKEPPRYVLGEGCWEPLATLCKSLKQGGVAELRARRLPPLPKQDEQADATSSAAAQLSMMMNKFKNKDKDDKDLYHCTVRAELERVIPAIAGPEDPRWEGVTAIVQECYAGQQCLDRGYEQAAMARFRRVLSWVDQFSSSSPSADEVSRARLQAASARASIGWILVSTAAPILDSGNVRSDILSAAQKDLEEAKDNWNWLNENFPDHAGTRLLKAKILVAEDDDFKGAYDQLILAQQAAPNNNRVQEELKKVKLELRKEEEENNKAKVAEIRDNLKGLRESGGKNDEIVALLKRLLEMSVSWETVMETRIGVEIKNCQDAGDDEVKRLCKQILGKLKDESKEQRPMWES